jgi:hypothetical protein
MEASAVIVLTSYETIPSADVLDIKKVWKSYGDEFSRIFHMLASMEPSPYAFQPE